MGKKEQIIAASIAGLVTLSMTASRLHAADKAADAKAKTSTEKASCKGKDTCKGADGKDTCKSKDSCKGKESCKGKDTCKSADGKDTCKSKDSCKGKDAKAAEAAKPAKK